MASTKNKNKRRKRRILLSLLMILLCGVVLSTSTYAWFTANRTVTVSDITVNVAATNGLQVSVDGINWKTIISNADITGAATTYPNAVNQLPSSTSALSPVSSVGEVDPTTGFMKMFAGDIQSNDAGTPILSATQSTETHGGAGNFVAFDLFVQTNAITQVYLTSNSKVSASGTSTGIENAARVAFINEGNVASGSATSAIQGLKADSTVNPFIWEVNNDVHTAAAVANASSVYGHSTSVTGGTQLPYYGVKAPITVANNIELNSQDATYFTAVVPQLSTSVAGISSENYASLMQLQAGITKVRIYMWVEGQDVDCENNASGGALTYSLQISANEKA